MKCDFNMKTPKETKENHTPLPIWIRAPKQGGTDYYCGLTRSKLYELARRGLIKSVSLAKVGETRGTRIFNLQSILEYIDTLDTNLKQT